MDTTVRTPIRITGNLLVSAIIGLMSVCIVYALATPQRANALDGSQFNAGRIIDDSVFYSDETMSVNQIQQFLNSKVPTCDTNGTQPHWSGGTRAQHGTTNGAPPPYVCLKSYSQAVPAVTNSGSDLCTGSISAGTKSAAQIIHETAQACGVNPQVLIVLLQKEQSLITDDWPWPIQYRSATGYGCPDTAPCDAEFYGFFNQVYQAAKAYRRYRANPTNYNYRAGRNNFIYYHPSLSACGGTNVFIENQATAGLYIYTPYQPNAAALNNLYGTGDSCSAYGNRNFWRMFNDWFGSTTGPRSYTWEVVSQKAFTDDTKTTAFQNYKPTLLFKDRAYLELKVKNTGNVVWNKSVKIGTFEQKNRTSKFCDSTWIACNRPASMKEPYVNPGEIATFEFWIRAPEKSGLYKEYFNLLWEGLSWFPTVGLYYPVNVIKPDLHGVLKSEKFYAKGEKNKSVKKDGLKNNSSYLAVYKIENVGTETWTQSTTNPVRLGTLGDIDSPLCHASWISCNRPAAMEEGSVGPGEIATFEFWFNTPFAVDNTKFSEKYRLLTENVEWLSYPAIDTKLVMKTPPSTWQLVSQLSYKNSAKSVASPTNKLKLSEERFIVVKIKNLSGKIWKNSGDSPIRLATNSPVNSTSLVCHESWISCNRPASMKEPTVAPGETATFEFWIRAKNHDLNYNESYRPVAENSYWLGDAGLVFHYRVGN